ncbi:lipase 1-like isoform 2-T2 [Cochliomyia hominivorax]
MNAEFSNSIYRKIQIYTIIFVSSHFIKIESKYLEDNYPATVIEDAHLDTAQLLMKYKYPVETHFVTTDDNYVLRMHRIPNPKAPPILLMHGLLDSSVTWLIMGPDKAPGYYFYEKGYDVWMGNARGNLYSRNHTSFNPNRDKEFWSFSWHEIGYFDLPVMIDHILNQTGYKKISYVGHSQGTTAFWVLCSLHPQYNSKITMMHALAPVAFCKHIKTPLLRHFRGFAKSSKERILEFLPHNPLMFAMCFTSKFMEDVCTDFLDMLMGRDSEQTNSTMYPVIFGHVPAGCNFKQFLHYLQLEKSNRFCQYDYGENENMAYYYQDTPPDYPLENITVSVALHYTKNDLLTNESDVKRLADILPNVVFNKLYPAKTWNHVTVLWGRDARKLVHEQIVELLKKYSYE